MIELVDLLSNPGAFAKKWLKDLNIEESKEKLDQLQAAVEREKRLLGQLYERLGMVEEVNGRILNDKISEHEKKHAEYVQELARAQREYNLAKNKYHSFAEFEKLFDAFTPLREKMKLKSKYVGEVATYIYSLPFKTRKKLVEAIISPETGGKIVARYPIPLIDGDYDERDLSVEERKRLLEPLLDQPPVLEFEFNADLDKIGNFIAGLDREPLLFKVNIG